MRNTGAGKRVGGGELVVCGCERVTAVQNRDTALLEQIERPETGLDPVQ